MNDKPLKINDIVKIPVGCVHCGFVNSHLMRALIVDINRGKALLEILDELPNHKDERFAWVDIRLLKDKKNE